MKVLNYDFSWNIVNAYYILISMIKLNIEFVIL